MPKWKTINGNTNIKYKVLSTKLNIGDCKNLKIILPKTIFSDSVSRENINKVAKIQFNCLVLYGKYKNLIDNKESIKKLPSFSKNLVYMFYDKELKKLYIGETTRDFERFKEHIKKDVFCDYNDYKVNTLCRNCSKNLNGDSLDQKCNKDKEWYKEKFSNCVRKKINKDNFVILISSKQFTKSAVVDIETRLIGRLLGNEKIKVFLSNLKSEQTEKFYFLQEFTKEKIEKIWGAIEEIKFEDKKSQNYFYMNKEEHKESLKLFYYSSLADLSPTQEEIIRKIFISIENNKKRIMGIKANAGTGKTLVAMKLFSLLASGNYKPNSDINVVLSSGNKENIKMFKNIREKFRTFRFFNETESKVNVKCEIKTLKEIIEMSKSKEKKDKIDFLIIDEASSIKKDDNRAPENSFNSDLWEGNEECNDQLDLIFKLNQHIKTLILLYDENQITRETDIDISNKLEKLKFNKIFKESIFGKGKYEVHIEEGMKKQYRMKNAEKYLNFIKRSFLEIKENKIKNQLKSTKDQYQFKFYKNYNSFKKSFDGKKYGEQTFWFSSATSVRSINSKKHLKEAFPGKDTYISSKSVETPIFLNDFHRETGMYIYYNNAQGFDCDYMGVYIGAELTFSEGEISLDEKAVLTNPANVELPKCNHNIEIKNNKNPSKKDKFKECSECQQLYLKWMKNRYLILLTRGIKGTHIFIEDETLREKMIELYHSENN